MLWTDNIAAMVGYDNSEYYAIIIVKFLKRDRFNESCCHLLLSKLPLNFYLRFQYSLAPSTILGLARCRKGRNVKKGFVVHV